MSFRFEKLSWKYKDIVFQWLTEPHMQEFWDNSQEHKDDIINFINGRQEPSNYFDGIFTYWIGFIKEEPFCFVLSAEESIDRAAPKIIHDNLSKNGTTCGLDFGIGNKKFLGKGLAAPALEAFVNFYKNKIDPKADTFFIDPDENNPRARHVYEKAGFRYVGEFEQENKYWDFASAKVNLMVKKI